MFIDKKTPKPLILRADADSQMGTGHVMRCMALAQAWQLEGGHAIFLSHCESAALRQRITDAGMELISVAQPHPESQDLQTTLEILRTRSAGAIGNPTWLVLDGYHFAPVYQQAVRRAGFRLLVIDDMAHLPAYHADIMLNQNLGAEKLNYNCDRDTILLLGSRYALLRQEFLSWRGGQREIPDVAHKVLVTMGGADPDNVTLKIIHALEWVQVDGLKTVIVVGGSNPHCEILQSAIRNLQPKIRLERDVPNMSELMDWADVAVSAGGSTCWELAFTGVPSVVLTLAENQRYAAGGLAESGVAFNLGWHEHVTPTHIAEAVTRLLLSPSARKEMSCRGRELVDGFGTDRVLMRMRGQRIRVRSACQDDAQLLWKWANDPSTREASFSSDPISWERHLTWLRKKLDDPGCFFYIAIDETETPIGQVRYDVDDYEATISISVGANYRGMGYGSTIIELASQKLCHVSGTKLIHSYVKPDNEASIRAFLRAGFKRIGVITHEPPSIHMIRSNGATL